MKASEFTKKSDKEIIPERKNNFVKLNGILYLAPPMDVIEAQVYRAQRRLEEIGLVDSAGLPTILEGIEEQKRNQEIHDFLALHSAKPVVGHEYNVLAILWNNTLNKWFDITTNTENYPLVQFASDKTMFEIEKLPRPFPPSPTVANSGTHYTMVFNSQEEKRQFITMLALKYGDWKFEIKDFITAESIDHTQL